MLDGAGLGSILLSILLWFRAGDDAGRLSAVFVGLWAPTFFVLGSALANGQAARPAEIGRCDDRLARPPVALG